MTPHQVSVAAESFAATILAQCGFNVSVQYGANQPDYDLLIEQQSKFAKISVKGSQVGGWSLAIGHKTKGRNVSYHQAIDGWLNKQKSDTIFIFVEFNGVQPGSAPRVYLATPREVADHLKSQCNGKGHLALAEDHLKYRPKAKRDDKIPDHWKFSEHRVKELIRRQGIS